MPQSFFRWQSKESIKQVKKRIGKNVHKRQKPRKKGMLKISPSCTRKTSLRLRQVLLMQTCTMPMTILFLLQLGFGDVSFLVRGAIAKTTFVMTTKAESKDEGQKQLLWQLQEQDQSWLWVNVGIALGCLVFAITLVTVYFLLQSSGSFERMANEAKGLPTSVGQLPTLLYDELLQKAQELPVKPQDVVLVGRMVQLRPVNWHGISTHFNLNHAKNNTSSSNTNTDTNTVGDEKGDAQVLYDISNGSAKPGIYGDKEYDADESIWRFLQNGPFQSIDEFKKSSIMSNEINNATSFVVVNVATEQIIGMVSLLNNEPRFLRIEIGEVWLVPSMQGSGVHTEVMYLLLKHLFGLGYRRIEFQVHGFNIRGRKAAHSIGFTLEGVLRKHKVIKKANVDTALFAMLNSDWNIVEEHLVKKLMRRVHDKSDESEVSSTRSIENSKTK